MAALTLTRETYRDKIAGAWQGKSAGLTLGAPLRGQRIPGRNNFYSPVPGQPVSSAALDFPVVWLETLQSTGPDVTPEDLAVAWLEHLDYAQDELGYAALNLRRGLPPPASGAHGNWFRTGTTGIMRADLWAMLCPGNPQVAASYAYYDATLDHCEDGEWAAMFLAALGSAAFFLTDTFTLLTIGLAMIPRTCRTARAVKTALAAAQRGASWLEARENVQHEVGSKNFSDVAQNMGFLTMGLLYGSDFGGSLCAAVNCGCDAEAVGGALGAILGMKDGAKNLPQAWIQPVGDIYIAGNGLRDMDAPRSLSEIIERTFTVGLRFTAERCLDVAITETLEMEGPPPDDAGDPVPDDGGAGNGDDAHPTPILPVGPVPPGPPPPPSPHPTTPGFIEELPGTPTPFSEPPPDSDNPDPAPAQAAPDAENTVVSTFGTTAAPDFTASAAPMNFSAAAVPDDETPTVESAFPAPTLPDTAPPMPTVQASGEQEAEPIPTAPPPSVSVVSAQSISEEEAPPVTEVSAVYTRSEAHTALAPDPMTAIAWTDSTLVKPLLVTPPTALFGQSGPFVVTMETGDSPTIAYGQIKALTFSITNRGEAFSGRIALFAPTGWQITPPQNLGQRQYLAADTGTFRGEFLLRVPEGQGRIEIANAIRLRFSPENGTPFEAEFILMGAACWWTVGPFANFDGEGFDRSYMPEDRPGLNENYVNRLMQGVRWEKRTFAEPVLDIEPLFKSGSGVVYGQTILRSPTDRTARIVANTSSGVKVWMNGALLLRRFNREPFRPTLGSGPWAADVSLRAGDNPVMVKWVRGLEPMEFSLTVSDRYGRGLPEISNTNW